MLCLGIEGTAHTLGIGLARDTGEILANMKSEYSPRTGGIHVEPGNSGRWYPSRCATMGEKNTTGMVSASDTQNRFLNIAVEWPACSP